MLDIVVVNYKTPTDLDGFLLSLQDFVPKVDWRLWIVNVCPEEADRLVAQRWERRFGSARYIEFDDNVGYGRACNRAAKAGTGDVIGFFNADVRLSDGALQECYDQLRSRDDWAALGPRQVDDDGRITHAGIFGTMAAPVHRAWQSRESPRYADVSDDAVTVSGAAYFIKRSVWQEMTDCPIFQEADPGAEGAFLQVPHYYNETWLSYHLQGHGYRCVYYGPVCIVHRWHKASPVGGYAERTLAECQAKFRAACDAHALPRD